MIAEPPIVDPILGVVRVCPTCVEDWPDDEEFYRPGDRDCRACVYDRSEARRTSVRLAARRYRARLRRAV